VIFDEKSITNGEMSGVANPFINTNQHYEASVDKMLDPRLELLKKTDDEPDSDDDETWDRTDGSTPFKFEESDDMDDVPIRSRRTVQPINCLTYDRLGGVLKELSEAGIVSVYGAYNSTNFKDMNLKLEDLCLNAMESALTFYDDLLNADIPKNSNKGMNAIDAVEWRESMQYKLDVLEERGV
jgi:hypothetical protein